MAHGRRLRSSRLLPLTPLRWPQGRQAAAIVGVTAALMTGLVAFAAPASATDPAPAAFYAVGQGGVGSQSSTGVATPLLLALNQPGMAVMDGFGDLFIADTSIQRVVEVPASGTPTVVDLTGLSDPFGCGQLCYPYGVAVDGSGNLFIADTYNNRVVEVPASGGVAASGTPTVVSVTGLSDPIDCGQLCNPQGVAVDGSGNLFIADTSNQRVVEVPASGGVAASGTPTVLDLTGLSDGACGQLCYPQGVAVDGSGNLFIADTSNQRVVEVPTSGTPTVVDLSGLSDGVCGQLCYPYGVAVDGSGDLFIADTSNSRVVEVPAAGGVAASGTPTVVDLTGLPDGSFGCGYQLCYPQGVAVDGSGNLLIADTNNNRVVEVPASGGVAASGTPTVVDLTGLSNGVCGQLCHPYGVAVDGSGNLFIADTNNQRVVEMPASGGVAASGTPTVVDLTGLPDGSFGCGYQLCYPQGVAVDGSGNLFIADTGNIRVVEVPASGTPTVVDLSGLSDGGCGQLCNASGVAVDGAGNLFIADTGNNRVVAVPASGGVAASGTPTVVSVTGLPDPIGCGQLCNPQGVAVDGSGNLFIADTGNNRVVEVPASGGVAESGTPTVVDLTGLSDGGCGQLCYPFGVAVDGSGNLLIADTYNRRVVAVPAAGGVAASGTATVVRSGMDNPWSSPYGIAVPSTPSAPVVSSVSPGSGPVTGGTSVTVTGSGFAAGDTVVIGQGNGATPSAISATDVVVVSPTQITATTGGGALVGTWNLFVVDAASHASAANSGDRFSYTEVAPAVSGVSPNAGPVSGGTSVTISGSGFAAGDTVVIGQGQGVAPNAIPATSVVVVDSTHITAKTGGGALVGTWNLFVVDAASHASDANSGDRFSYTEVAPAVSGVSPNAGPVTGGTSVTISGSGFAAGDTVVIGQGQGVAPNAIPATSVVVVDSTHITAKTGGGALVGTWNLFVVDAASHASDANSGDRFSYTEVAPVVSSVAPNAGPVTGGTSVTVTGSGFAAGDTVVIGQGNGATPSAISATDVVVVSPTQITATTGGGALAGTWNLFVVDAASHPSTANSGDVFTYTAVED